LRLKTESERLKEELTKLKLELEKFKADNGRLCAENLRLIGHQNVKQKIQHHMKIKKENDSLRQDKIALEKEVKRLRELTKRGSKKQGIGQGQENIPPASSNLSNSDKEDEFIVKGKITDRTERKDSDYFHQLVDIITSLDSNLHIEIPSTLTPDPDNSDPQTLFGFPLSPDPENPFSNSDRLKLSSMDDPQVLYQKSLQHLQNLISQLKSERRSPLESIPQRSQVDRRKNTTIEKTLFG